MSPGQEMGRFVEEVELELGLPIVGIGILELLGSNGLILLLWVSQEHAQNKWFLIVSLGEPWIAKPTLAFLGDP